MNPRVLITAFGLKLWMISVNTFGLVKCHVAGSFPSSAIGLGVGSVHAPPTKTFPPDPQSLSMPTSTMLSVDIQQWHYKIATVASHHASVLIAVLSPNRGSIKFAFLFCRQSPASNVIPPKAHNRPHAATIVGSLAQIQHSASELDQKRPHTSKHKLT